MTPEPFHGPLRGSPSPCLPDLTCSRSCSVNQVKPVKRVHPAPVVLQEESSKDFGPRFYWPAKPKCDGCATQASTAAGNTVHHFPELCQTHSGRCLLWNQASATSNPSSDTTTNSTVPALGPASPSHAFGQRWPFHGQGDASHAVWQRVPTPTPIYEGNPTCAKNGQGSGAQKKAKEKYR